MQDLCDHQSPVGHPVYTSFEHQIKALCERICSCQSDEESISLAQQMRELLHNRIEEIRSKGMFTPDVAPDASES